MRLSIETNDDGTVKMSVERDDGKKLDYEGTRDDFELSFKPVRGKKDDDMIVDLYARFRTQHPKKTDGQPVSPKDKK
jgi:hypothetical protein